MKLSKFLQILEGFKKSDYNTKQSFWLGNLIHKTNVIENFSKNKDIWEIRNILKKLKLGKDDEIDIRLFLLNKINPNYILNILNELKNNPGNNEKVFIKIYSENFDKSEFLESRDFLTKLKYFDFKYHKIKE